jgi:hypothetical protein
VARGAERFPSNINNLLSVTFCTKMTRTPFRCRVNGVKKPSTKLNQPYNLAMVTLDADPRVNFYSNLPGTPPYQVPVGAAVAVTFEEVAPGQLIHEWRVVA